MIIHTANILGIFSDPFEFDGDYGSEINPVREKVFELVLSKDPEHGPTLKELIDVEQFTALINHQKSLHSPKFTESDLLKFRKYLDEHADKKLFYTFRNLPAKFLKLDKVLRDNEIQLPILSSNAPIAGATVFERKKNLMQALFTDEVFTKATDTEQVFMFWLYQCLNLHLLSEQDGLVDQVNRAKEIFNKTIGDPQMRADQFRKKLIASNNEVLFTQESDSTTAHTLTHDGMYLPVDAQNNEDGTFVFLRSDVWQASYTVLQSNAKANVVLAERKDTHEKFVLASCHGNSTNAEDGRQKIAEIVELFRKTVHEGCQLIIGIDANTKNEKDVALLREQLTILGLVATDVGPTTVKKRMVTVQHSKEGRAAVDEEDFIIILKDGRYTLANQTVGFSSNKVDPNKSLPNNENPSDHYAVGVSLIPK